MTGKMRIIILVAIAIAGFGVSYFVSGWFGGGGKPAPQTGQVDVSQTPELSADGIMPTLVQPVEVGMKERELTVLIKELRVRIDVCRSKERILEKRGKRIQMAAEMLEKQAKELEALRMQLDAPLLRLREVIVELENTRIRIDTQEKSNIKALAQRYDKMDAESGGRILTQMCKNKQEDDAVKILRYMSARASAKLLSGLTDAALAARLCEKLKKVQEEG